jgi:hypothetical protein
MIESERKHTSVERERGKELGENDGYIWPIRDLRKKRNERMRDRQMKREAKREREREKDQISYSTLKMFSYSKKFFLN